MSGKPKVGQGHYGAIQARLDLAEGKEYKPTDAFYNHVCYGKPRNTWLTGQAKRDWLRGYRIGQNQYYLNNLISLQVNVLTAPELEALFFEAQTLYRKYLTKAQNREQGYKNGR